MRVDFGPPLHSLVLCGEIHPLETEVSGMTILKYKHDYDDLVKECITFTVCVVPILEVKE